MFSRSFSWNRVLCNQVRPDLLPSVFPVSVSNQHEIRKRAPTTPHNVENEAYEAGGGSEALHGPLLPGLRLDLPDVRAHVAARSPSVRVSPVRFLLLRPERQVFLRTARGLLRHGYTSSGSGYRGPRAHVRPVPPALQGTGPVIIVTVITILDLAEGPPEESRDVQRRVQVQLQEDVLEDGE